MVSVYCWFMPKGYAATSVLALLVKIEDASELEQHSG